MLTGPGTTKGASGQPWRGYDPTTAGRHWTVPRRALETLRAEGVGGIENLELHEQLELLYQHGFIRFPEKKTGQGVPEFKLYLGAGQPVQDIILDIPPLNSQAKERLGYPTQKPIALLERILQASSNPGDTVFDPFCGCGTAIYAAQETNRQWIGCDIAILSVRIVRDILLARYGLKDGEHYEVSGIPLSIDGARELFEHDPRQFQHWAVELAGGFCNMKHSGDMGIDGRIYFETAAGLQSMVVSVKGGHLAPAHVRELRGTLEREGRAAGRTQLAGFICLSQPTKGMESEAASAGQFVYQGMAYDRVQIRTVDDLLAGRGFTTPSRVQTMNWQKQLPLPLLVNSRAGR